MLLVAFVRSVSAQGSPDIVWQGAHTGYVRYTTFSPDGQQLASGGDNKQNKLWQVSDGTLIRTITHCSGICGGPTFGLYSPDSQQLATSGIKFWRVSDGMLIRTLGIGGTLAFSPDWQYIASSATTSSYPTQIRTITLFRTSDGSQVWTKPSAGGGATAFSPDGQLIASIGFQGIDIFRASDGTLVRDIVGPRGSVLAFSRDGQFIATNGGAGGSYRYDETIKIFRVSDGSLVRTLTATGAVTSIVFTPDGQTMIAGSSDSNEDPVNGFIPATGTIRFWRVSDGALLKTYDQNTGTSAHALSVSPDGQLFSYSHDSTVAVARVPSSFCVFSISPTSVNLPWNGGSGSVNVTAPAECSWSASSRVSWITLTGNNSGTGNGTVTYTTSGGADGITGLLIIAEQAFPIHFGSDPCIHTVSPTNVTWSSSGGTGTVGVQTQIGCGWSAASNDSWITITKINHDSGNGGITYSVAANAGPARTGTLTVADQTITIDQGTPTSPTPTPTPAATPTPAPTPMPTPTPAATPTPAPTPMPTASPGATPTSTPTPAPTASPGATPTSTPPPASTASPTATPPSPPQPLNISTRSRVQGGDSVLIGGFILRGSDSKRVVIRAIGPSLGANGMTGAVSDTTLDLYDSSGHLLASNDNWRESQQAQIEATGVAPSDPLESAIVATLSGNASYTAVVRGKGGATGVGLVEVYDLGLSSNSKLANISTRGFVDTGDHVMIGGFIVGGTAADRTRIVVRAIGPSLGQFGITNALQDPTLSVYDSNGNVLGTNDNWRDANQPEIAAAGLAPTDDRESALFRSLSPGAYTVTVAGKGGTVGVGLVEAYSVQ